MLRSRAKLTETRYAVSSPEAATVAKRQGSACRCSNVVMSAAFGRHQSATRPLLGTHARRGHSARAERTDPPIALRRALEQWVVARAAASEG